MLYAVLGALLEKAAAVLRSPAVADGGEHADVQRRRVAAFMARLGRMWPGLGPALIAQNAVLELAADQTVGAALEAGAGWERRPGALGTAPGSVSDHVRLLTELDAMVIRLHREGDHGWAVAARRRLRANLRQAATIEMALVEGTDRR